MQDCREISPFGGEVRRNVDVACGDEKEILKQFNQIEKDFLKLSNPKNTVVTTRSMRVKGSHRCPCGSGRLFKNCHKRKIKK